MNTVILKWISDNPEKLDKIFKKRQDSYGWQSYKFSGVICIKSIQQYYYAWVKIMDGRVIDRNICLENHLDSDFIIDDTEENRNKWWGRFEEKLQNKISKHIRKEH